MERPYIVCHMVTSIDGKVTGDFLFRKECAEATELYYEINRNKKANGFICGRVTMEESFTKGYYPDLSKFEPKSFHAEPRDFLPDKEHMSGFYAVAFDTNGKLGWESNRIIDPDGDPGYDGALIVEVLSENVDKRYLAYLEAMEIPYIFAGKSAIDVKTALSKLYTLIGADTLLLEGGSVINGAFQRADAIDELSLVVAPVVAGADSKPLFTNSSISDFELLSADADNGGLYLSYKRKI